MNEQTRLALEAAKILESLNYDGTFAKYADAVRAVVNQLEEHQKASKEICEGEHDG